MKININELNIKKEIKLDYEVSFLDENFSSLGIKCINSCSFVGKVWYNVVDEICLLGDLKCSLVLYDSTDLSDYLYEINIKIDEIIENFDFSLDINEILWENIVLEVPMRATNKTLGDASGDGWKVKSDNSSESIDPRLAKLQELIKGGE